MIGAPSDQTRGAAMKDFLQSVARQLQALVRRLSQEVLRRTGDLEQLGPLVPGNRTGPAGSSERISDVDGSGAIRASVHRAFIRVGSKAITLNIDVSAGRNGHKGQRHTLYTHAAA